MSPAVNPRRARFRLALVILFALSGAAVGARQDEPKNEPPFHEFKGVRINMSVQEAREKLGVPTEKSDALDFYNVSDKQTIQVYYDAGKVTAIALMFMDAGADAMTPKAVFGTNLEAKPDGSMYKLVRFAKAGYFVSYSRTAGDSPLVSVTIQKIR